MATNKYICVKENDFGVYLEPSDPEGDVAPLRGHSSEVGPGMVFERIPVEGDLFVYRGSNDRYWEVRQDRSPWIVSVGASTLQSASRFREVWFSDDRVALLFGQGFFVRVDVDLELVFEATVDSRTAGEAEKLWFEIAPAGLTPERPASTGQPLEKALSAEGQVRLEPHRASPPSVPAEARIDATTTPHAPIDPSRLRPMER